MDKLQGRLAYVRQIFEFAPMCVKVTDDRTAVVVHCCRSHLTNLSEVAAWAVCSGLARPAVLAVVFDLVTLQYWLALAKDLSEHAIGQHAVQQEYRVVVVATDRRAHRHRGCEHSFGLCVLCVCAFERSMAAWTHA